MSIEDEAQEAFVKDVCSSVEDAAKISGHTPHHLVKDPLTING